MVVGQHVAEKLGIPAVLALPIPMYVPAREFPWAGMAIPRWWPSALNRATLSSPAADLVLIPNDGMGFPPSGISAEIAGGEIAHRVVWMGEGRRGYRGGLRCRFDETFSPRGCPQTAY